MDKRVFEILDKEVDRQTSTIELIASENFAPRRNETSGFSCLQTSMLKDIRQKIL